MESGSIVYFHPPYGQTHTIAAAKRHWWQKADLQGREVVFHYETPPFLLTACEIPPFYYRDKRWPPQLLSEAMDMVLQNACGMAKPYLHPQIVRYVSEMYAARWEADRETLERLMESMLASYGASCLYEAGAVTVLLGGDEDRMWQMEMTGRLLAPYLPRINSLLFYYEEREEIDVWEETAELLEDYAYEYGLAAEMLPYQKGKSGWRCGKKRCRGLLLDYREADKGPMAEPEERAVYLRLFPDPAKESACVLKYGQVLYASPLKYLDTVVKNSYHRTM